MTSTQTHTTTDAGTDWYAWHAEYDELTSARVDRLAVVQELLGGLLDAAPEGGPVTVISIASGQSRDLLPVVIAHARRDDVRARVVELDERNVDFAAGAGDSAGLSSIEYVAADAGTVDAFAGFGRADVVLLGELLGLLDDAGAHSTIDALPQLCAAGATVVVSTEDASRLPGWTARFAARGFEAVRQADGVAAYRYVAEPAELVPGTRLFDLA